MYLSRTEYRQLGTAGVLGPGDRVELLRGIVVRKTIRTVAHLSGTRRLASRLPAALPAGWFAQFQDTIGLPDSEPEPDGAVLRGTIADYDKRLPEAADVGIVIEVADSTLRTDRREKGRSYAAAGIPVYWIVNVADGVVEVYRNPTAFEYAARTDVRPGDAVPVVLDGNVVGTISAAELLP